MRSFLVFFITIFCFGNCDFSEFDEEFSEANIQKQQELHNEVKAQYIKAVMNDDKQCIISSLQRIIRANDALGIENQNFENELATLTNTKKNTQKNTQNSTTIRVLNISSEKNKLKIKLNNKISLKDIRNFTIDEKHSFRDVYDINGTLSAAVPKISSDLADKIRIAQKDINTVRIVFEHKSKKDISANIVVDELIFTAKNENLAQTSKEQKTAKNSANSNDKAKNLAQNAKNSSQNSKSVAQKSQTKETKTPTILSNAKPQIVALSKKEKANKIIVIDPGHGGNDAGAISINKKLYEKNIVLSVSKKTANILKDRGYKVYYTRSNDRFVKLRDRTSFANEKNAHLFLSIHANATKNGKANQTSGIETFFLSPSRSERAMNAANLENKADTDEMNYFTKISFLNFLNREKIIASNKLAIDIQDSLLKSVKQDYKVNDGGVREAPFWVLVGALMPAVLIEIGYITHPDESKLIANAKYQDKIALGIANGVDEYFAKNR